MKDILIALVRTLIPAVVGAVATYFAAQGIEIDAEAVEQALEAGLVPIIGGLYYVVVRALEERWPWAGYLLGVASKPSYVLAA